MDGLLLQMGSRICARRRQPEYRLDFRDKVIHSGFTCLKPRTI
jgi:hypothetical protein